VRFESNMRYPTHLPHVKTPQLEREAYT